jgi:hypothetical protein
MRLENPFACEHFECPVCSGRGYRPYLAADTLAQDPVAGVSFKCLACSFCFSSLEGLLKPSSQRA